MSDRNDIAEKNRRTLLTLGALAIGMFGFGFALVPLYGLFCQITGVQSLEQRSAAINSATAAPMGEIDKDRWVTVKFDATVHPDLPWRFEPLQRSLKVRPGEMQEVVFAAENRSNKPVTGQAIPSVAPWQATGFLSKLECFCFNNQRLEGGERKEMPLRFAVSPDLPQDIRSMTLSYSFLRLKSPELALNPATR